MVTQKDFHSLTLKELFQIIPAHLPDQSTIKLRTQLCEFLREHEAKFFDTTHAEDQHRIRELLGWDDISFQSFIHAPIVTNSSPHASFNVFSPNFAHPWLHTAIHQVQKEHCSRHTMHLRTMVTHNNLGDLKYKTYAWWHRDQLGNISKASLFSRNHSVRHKTLLSQKVPHIDTNQSNNIDKEAIKFATKASNYAYACILYRSYLEQAAGICEPYSKIELPFDLLSAFYFYGSEPKVWEHAFIHGFQNNQQEIPVFFRTINAQGELEILKGEFITQWHEMHRENFITTPIIAHNFINFALIYSLGTSVLTGGKKMYGYLDLMNSIIKDAQSRLKLPLNFPWFLGLPSVPDSVIPVTAEENSKLTEQGAQGCFAIGVASYGQLIRSRLDQLLPETVHPLLLTILSSSSEK